MHSSSYFKISKMGVFF